MRYLKELAQLVPDPAIADLLEKQKSFDRLRGTGEFSSILGSFRRFRNFWDSPALDTPFQEDLAPSEKLAGLSKFWSEIKYNCCPEFLAFITARRVVNRTSSASRKIAGSRSVTATVIEDETLPRCRANKLVRVWNQLPLESARSVRSVAPGLV